MKTSPAHQGGSTATASRIRAGRKPVADTGSTTERHSPDLVVESAGVPEISPGLKIFMAKGPGYWTEPEGADDYPVATTPVPPEPQQSHPGVHLNRTGTYTTLEHLPPSEGLKSFLAKPDDYWTNPDYS